MHTPPRVKYAADVAHEFLFEHFLSFFAVEPQVLAPALDPAPGLEHLAHLEHLHDLLLGILHLVLPGLDPQSRYGVLNLPPNDLLVQLLHLLAQCTRVANLPGPPLYAPPQKPLILILWHSLVLLPLDYVLGVGLPPLAHSPNFEVPMPEHDHLILRALSLQEVVPPVVQDLLQPALLEPLKFDLGLFFVLEFHGDQILPPLKALLPQLPQIAQIHLFGLDLLWLEYFLAPPAPAPEARFDVPLLVVAQGLAG